MTLLHLTLKGLRQPLFIAGTVKEPSCTLVTKHRRGMTSRVYSEDEYTDTPEYPPILDLNPQSMYRRGRDQSLDKLKQIGTVEEKLIGINIPRFYGWNSLILKEGNYPFNFMPFVQHITRTDFLNVQKLPFSNNLSQSELESLINKIRPLLKEALVLEVAKKRHRHEVEGTAESMGEGELSDKLTVGVVEQINRILVANLAQQAPHLYEAEIDYEPRIEAFWRVGGFHPDNETYEKRKKDKKDYEKELKTNRYAKRKTEEDPADLVGHFIQYVGQPVLQLRSFNPLKPLEPSVSVPAEPGTSADGAVSPNLTWDPALSHIPVVKYDPGFYGLEKIRRHGTNIPGFWPGDPNEFGLLSFHSCGHLLGRPSSFGDEDFTHTVNAQAILAGYAWLLAQANYQGFSTFHELTYPLATTTVVTDGRNFSFFASQLNTLLLHDEFIDTNPKFNVCYGLPSAELYQSIEGNEIVGWNDEVLSLLITAYVNTPAAREGVDMKPYLDKDQPLVQDLKHNERRAWLHQNFRHLFANRPRHISDPEIFDWEEIYKIKFDTRPLDPKRKFFELGVDPFKRRLDDRKKVYIPKKLRDPENNKKKYRDMFYPDC